MASSFVRGALSGTTTVHGTPNRRALHATPCAMLPALAVYAPVARRSRPASSMAFAAPRSLNDPMGWRFSSLSQSSPAACGTSSLTSGVRTTRPSSRCRAARTSASVISSGVGMPQAAEVEPGAGAPRDGAIVDAACRGDVLDREAERLEHRDLLRRSASGYARRLDEQLADLAHDVVVADESFALRDEEVAGLVHRGLASIDVETRAGDGRAIELARGRQARADGVHVRAGCEPPAVHDRLARRGQGADDVRAIDRLARAL